MLTILYLLLPFLQWEAQNIVYKSCLPKNLMDIEDEIQYLFGLRRLGMKLGLEPIKEITKKLDNPQKKYKIIHVAGTNGKGSTSAMIANILKCSGYKVGLFTSPHLIKYNERFRVNGEQITNEDLSRRIKLIREKNVDLTFFEFSTAIALQYFKEQKVDFAVVEVGLGGTWDSTNVVDGDVAVLTSIGLDHTEFLGDSVKEITEDKCGIIKQKSIVVANKENKGLEVIKKHAKKLMLVDKYKGPIGLLGEFQKSNAALAAKTCELFGVSEGAIEKGIKTVEWSGRLEYIKNNILLDCAHNIDGIEEVTKFVKGLKYKRLIIVFGVTKNKDYVKMIKSLPKSEFLIFTKPKINKALDPVELAQDKKHIIIENPKEALTFAKNLAKPNDLVLVTGSCYLVGNIKESVNSETFA